MSFSFRLAAIAALAALAAPVAAVPSVLQDDNYGGGGDPPFVDNSNLNWHKDATHSLKASSFIKLGQTILTKFPLFLKPSGDEPDPTFGTLPTAPGIGNEQVIGNVMLNSYVGEAHGYCYGLTVEDAEEDYAFRVCTAAEVNALTAVTKLPGRSTAVLTYTSKSGLDYELGILNDDPLVFVKPASEFTNPRPDYTYGSVLSTPQFPPSPPLPVNDVRMQTFSGSEEGLQYWNAFAYIDVVAYCCAGKFTLLNGAGGGASCFGGGSLVKMSNGSEVPIETIAAGDYVTGWSSAKAALSGFPARPMRVGTTQHTPNGPELYGFRLGREGRDDLVIPPFITANHAVVSKTGWVALDPVAAQVEVDNWVPTPGVAWSFSDERYTPVQVNPLLPASQLLLVEDEEQGIALNTARIRSVDQVKNTAGDTGPDVYSLELEEGDDAVYIVNGLLVIG